VTDRRFGFVQWEFAGRLGPDPGRYPVRRFAGDDVREIVVIGGLEAPRRVLVSKRRRAKAVSEPGEHLVEVTRATVIDAAPMYEREAAEAWLEEAAGTRAEEVVAGALAVLNRAVAGHRISAADPLLPDADPARALVTRVGYGAGEQVAEGQWEAARELPVPRDRRSRALVPQQRLAALLGGRDVALACEELTLRARADLDAGRQREAAMQLHLALEAAVAELESWRGRSDIGRRIDELAGLREPVAAAANAAIQGGLEPGTVAEASGALERLEAALRARAALEAASGGTAGR
jgi:hypothetical protein